MHALIVGPRGVGKSTLLNQVVSALNMPVTGFETRKETQLEDPRRGSPVYIYEAGQPHVQTPENLVGYCLHHHMDPLPEGFDRFAPRLTTPVPEGYLIKLDEIGFLESNAPAFRQAILTLLDGDRPVIAAVKDKDFPFLNTVRAHPNCRCFHITPENRDSLLPQVLTFLRAQRN